MCLPLSAPSMPAKRTCTREITGHVNDECGRAAQAQRTMLAGRSFGSASSWLVIRAAGCRIARLHLRYRSAEGGCASSVDTFCGYIFEHTITTGTA